MCGDVYSREWGTGGYGLFFLDPALSGFCETGSLTQQDVRAPAKLANG